MTIPSLPNSYCFNPLASEPFTSLELDPISAVPSWALFIPTLDPPPWTLISTPEWVWLYSDTSFSATGCTLVEPTISIF